MQVTVWLLLFFFDKTYVGTAPVFPPFATEQDCLVVVKNLKDMEPRNASVDARCVKTNIIIPQ